MTAYSQHLPQEIVKLMSRYQVQNLDISSVLRENFKCPLGVRTFPYILQPNINNACQ